MVSSALYVDGDTLMIRFVLELPPSEFCSSRVSFESLNGTCVLRPSVSALMTWPRALRLLLMFLASSSCVPVALVFLTISDPARSTSTILPVFVELLSVLVLVISTVKTLCDREDPEFMPVAATARFDAPLAMVDSSSSGPVMYCSVTPEM
eukprot:scaffold2319_cov248-Pinguiococcus_pyrenoidosus.AAC.5